MKPLLPSSFDRYFEPFLGGGALFFLLQPQTPHLSDINQDLIDTYTTVRDDVDALIQALGVHHNDKEHYYATRAIKPETLAPPQRAARMIFMNRTGFNGLYRVNKKGEFNVPFGKYKNPRICDTVTLRSCANALAHARISHRPFDAVLNDAQKGDFIYFDPPYVPLSPTSQFTSYIPGGFGLQAQEHLADVFRQLTDKGIQVMLSNSDTPLVRKLYSGFPIKQVQASRSINSNASRRGKVNEVIVRNYQ